MKWRTIGMKKYPGNIRVLEYESIPPGITRFQIREPGKNRRETFSVGGQVYFSLEKARARLPA